MGERFGRGWDRGKHGGADVVHVFRHVSGTQERGGPPEKPDAGGGIVAVGGQGEFGAVADGLVQAPGELFVRDPGGERGRGLVELGGSRPRAFGVELHQITCIAQDLRVVHADELRFHGVAGQPGANEVLRQHQ